MIITPNPSYTVDPNSSQSGKESAEYQYEYIQPDDALAKHDGVAGYIAAGGVQDDLVDTVHIDPNPSYNKPQL